MLAAKLALEYGLACSTGGGTHHAFPSHGSGFCMLNDLAVTARDMTDSKVVGKILIVDLDVHQVCSPDWTDEVKSCTQQCFATMLIEVPFFSGSAGKFLKCFNFSVES